MLGTATKLQNARNIKLQGAVSGNANFDGSGNVTIVTTQANIAILEGELTKDGQTTTTVINYPEGYNKNNCVVLSKEAVGGSTAAYPVYTNGTVFNSYTLASGGITLAVSLVNNHINISARIILLTDGVYPMIKALDSTSGMKFGYRIVLMKIR